MVGGGNVAMDAARTALRLGAEKVYLVYRRSREEMPARIEEIHHAEEEGIEFHLLTNPVRVPRERGRVRGGGGVPADGAGRAGRVRAAPPGPDAGIGVPPRGGRGDRRHRQRREPAGPATTPGLDATKWGNIVADEETGKTSRKGVFAGGDIVIGAATVILAMGAGRKAAAAIDEYLKTGAW